MSTREQMVSKATGYVKGLARRRSNKQVSADDVQNFLNKSNFRGSTNERMSIVRSVLRTPTFSAAGSVQSLREEARGRMITAWTI